MFVVPTATGRVKKRILPEAGDRLGGEDKEVVMAENTGLIAVFLTLWFVWVIIALVVSALTGYYISAEKGRGGFEGFLLGLLFGPIGLLLAVLMPEPPKRVQPIFPPASVFSILIFVICLAVMVGIILANRPKPSVGVTATPSPPVIR
jgi:drug/metabolite transporter (DMT)-like permease